MSKKYEFQGKSIEKALEQASTELNLPVDKIKHEVVTYGSSGIFGLVGVKKAKIKVILEEEKRPTEQKNNAAQKIASRQQTKEAENIIQSDKLKDAVDQAIDEDIIQYGKQCLQTIIDGISNGAEVLAEQRPNKLLYSISGGDCGVMIGKRGQTLEAIQYLLEKMINKRRDQRVRVIVDIEGYLEKRKTNLKQMASRMAEKAKKLKKPVTIGQMNAHDRRIVHIHLKNENGIRTQSIGDGYYRKLMIFPKKNVPKKK
jgi:spoIIIJ-associated protein